MFQRALLRQSQATKSALSTRPLSTISFSQRIALPAQSSHISRQLPPRLCQRYASTESEGGKNGEDAAEANKENGGKAGEATESSEGDVQKQLAAKDREVVELKDKYLRSVAEFRNLQERTRREVEAARQFAIQRFAADLIESIDNFERALGAVPSEKVQATKTEENKDLLELYSGLRMTEDILLKTLKKHGLERFDPSELVEGQAQKFDPSLHEATFMALAEGKNDGEVMHTQTKGFTLNGRVLRAAKVGVVKNA